MRRATEAEPEEPLALERNLAVMAGAGAGKTYSLITICLHLLGGARRDGVALRPADLFLLTFTDKAAGEMRTRLRERVDRLARNAPGAGEELELQASFARHGRPFPPADFWRRVRDELGAATIGTFHSLCVQLLRRAPAGFGVDPSFELLEEGEATALLEDCAERVLLEALERGDAGVDELCGGVDFRGQGLFRPAGLVESLCRVLTRVREEGQAPASIASGDEALAHAQFEEAVREVRGEIEVAAAAAAQKDREYAPILRRFARALDGMTAANFLQPGRWPEVRRAMWDEGLTAKRESMRPVKYGLEGNAAKGVFGLIQRYAAITACRQEETFRRLLVALQARHREQLERRGALDFTELLIRTRDLLRDEPSVRREVQGRVQALLVDEFQDTNRLQLELVILLAEKREGAPRLIREGDEQARPRSSGQLGLPLDGRRGRPMSVEEVPLEPAMLAAVGDRKQSIYEFRGADVAVFERLARQIERHGGARHFLRHNRRSSPALLGFFNGVFARVMQPREDGRDYEVAYAPGEDDLEPIRAQQVTPPAVERLAFQLPDGATTVECRRAEADALARRLAALLADQGAAIVVGEAGVPRRARGGDIAILLRAFTNLETYRQALVRQGVPHRVVRGRGFYGAQEVMDLASLLALIADRRDRISFAAVLRSPLVALSDASLFQLAGAEDRRSNLLELLEHPGSIPALPAEERARLDVFLAVYRRLWHERDRLGIRLLLQAAIEETGFRVALAGTAFAEQALANIDKLLELAGRHDARGSGDLSGFARELVRLAEEEPREAQADVLEAGDPRAVQLLTIHRAKGLEWPIVVVPDLAAQSPPRTDRVLFDRREGLALKPMVPGESSAIDTPALLRVRGELNRRDAAEALRTLYVALTRARDRLILSGDMPRARKSCWRRLLDGVIDSDARLRAAVAEVAIGEPAEANPRPSPPESSGDHRERVERAVDRARRPPPPAPQELVLAVTQLQDFFLCSRRYFHAHEMGLAEHPSVLELSPEREGEPSDPRGGDPRRRGTLAHALLEQVDLSLVRSGGRALREHLEKLLWALGERPEDPPSQLIVGAVEAFLGTRFAARVAEAGEAHVHRELPFLLRVGGEGERPALFLKGKIDLLLEEADGSALVLDYKFSRPHPEGLEPYGFQLDCYALAARQFVREGVPVRTGIAFLEESGREPDLRSEAGLDAAALSRRLMAGAGELLERSRLGRWEGRPRAECERIRCGYRYHCHDFRAPSGRPPW